MPQNGAREIIDLVSHLKLIKGGGEKKPYVDTDTCDLLRSLLEDAEQGDLVAAVAIVVSKDEESFYMASSSSADYAPQVLFAIEKLKLDMLREEEED